MTTATTPAPTRSPLPEMPVRVIKRVGLTLVRNRPLLLVILTIVLVLFMSLGHREQFLTTSNFQAVLVNAAQSGILVVGMMVLMIGGSFDLSIGSILALSGVVSGVLIVDHEMSILVAVLGGIAAGAICGLINGLIVTKIRINALIATLATMGIFRGITQLISGTGVGIITDDFARIGQSVWLGLQSPFWLMLGIAAAGSFLVSQTRFFRQYYFIGGNERAARLSGIRTQRMILIAFILMGTLAGFAGVLGAARLNSAVVSAGIGVELQVITAAVLGGASLKGGEGSVIGGVLGVFFIALVANSLIILQVDVFWQNIIVGLVLLVAVSLDRWKQVTSA